ncbi:MULTISPECIES: carbohydrate ABC transporter permease [unclassified Brachybacterium]|uniref:carbohydrate ABC transporter permease n=1 Tax=unclassified Brachybacterium TaxID=2623841 RepID=UPI0036134B85
MTSTATRESSSPPAVPGNNVRRRRGVPPIRRKEMLAGYGFVVPTVVLFVLFVGYPILRTVYLSTTEWSGFGEASFIGLENYARAASDPVTRRAFLLTVAWALVTTALQTAIPLVIAAMVASVPGPISVLVRTALFMPGIVSFVVSGVLWRLIYDPNFGTLNAAIQNLGFESFNHPWLGSANSAIPALMVVAVWQGLGMSMLILFAGIQGIDPGLQEAAMVDGAGTLQRFRHVTLPSLRYVTAIVIALNLMNGFKVFDLIYVMTGGGPNNSTQVLGTYLYDLAFGSTSGSVPQLGYASGLSVIVMALCTVAVLFQMRLSRRASR